MSSSLSSDSDSELDFQPRRRNLTSMQVMKDIQHCHMLKEKGLLNDSLLTEMVKAILRGTKGVATNRKRSKIKNVLNARRKKSRRPASPMTKKLRQIVEKPLLKRLGFFFYCCMLS